MIHRTLLLAPGDGARAVIDHLLTDGPPSEAQLRAWWFGADHAVSTLRFSPDGAQLEEVPPPAIDYTRLHTLTGDDAARPIGWGWTFDGTFYSPPPPPPRIVSGAEFLALFTASEVAALWTADPRLMAAVMRVLAQNSANLASPEAADLLLLAVAKGVLTDARANQVLAGELPA